MSERRLSRFVHPSVTEARIVRQWEWVYPRSLKSRWRRRIVPALAMAAGLAVLIGIGWQGRLRFTRSPMEGAVIESGAVKLADGSSVALAQGSRVRVVTVRDDTVELMLEAGAIDLDVPHGPRKLVVRTPGYDVVDMGTRFRVAVGAQGDLRVDVAEGSVEVRSHDGLTPVRKLVGGESWSNVLPVAAQPAPSATQGADPATDSLSTATSPRDGEPVGTPKDLLEMAERARLAGHARAAAAALDTLRRHYRTDPRAALAAFELGRLRLDLLNDAAGAVDALNDAMGLSPRGPLREDAEARRVEALAAEHSAGCASARDAFLARYPGSAHAAVVTRQCAE